MKILFRLAAVCVCLASGARAATQSWKGLFNGVWATSAVDPSATNWTGNVTWTDGNDATFGQGGTVTATVATVVSVRSITTSGGQNLIITNGILNLGVGGLNSLANNNNFKIFSDVVLTANQTWVVNPGLTVYGPVSGAANLTLAGLNSPSPTTLAGSNSFTGVLTVRDYASVKLDYSLQNNSKIDAASGLIVTNGGTVSWSGGGTVFTQAVNGVTLTGAGNTTFSRAGQNNVLRLGTLTRSTTYNTLAFGAANIATVSLPNTNNILGGWAITAAGWARNLSGGADGTAGLDYGTDDNNPGTGWLATENVSVSSTLATPPTSRTINSLRMGGLALLNLNGATLTLASGGLMAANGNPTINNGFLQSGLPSGELFVHALNNANLTNAAVIQDNGATPTVLVKAGAQTLYLSGANTYSGMTYINQGTLQIGAAGAAGDLANSTGVMLAGGNLTFNRSDAFTFRPPITGNGIGTVARSAGSGALTLGPINGAITTLTDSSTNGSLAPTVITQSVANLTIGTLNGASGSVVIFTGSGTTTISGVLAVSNQLVRILNGTVTNSSARNMAANLQVDGGRLVVAGDRLGMTNNAQSLAVNGGQLSVTGTYGIRLNGDNGTATADKTGTVTAVQTGGIVSITTAGLQLGNLTGGTTAYSLSGGTLNCAGNGVTLGNATTGAGTTTFTLSGTGKLLAGGTISGSQGAGAIQNFVFNGGTLAAATVDMTKLTTAGATTATPATLFNNGGTLAPGDIGTAGKTIITGSFTNSPAAALAIDLGGATQATAFQTGQYDFLNVNNGAAQLDGRLSVNLINGFVPSATNTFDVLTSTGTGAAVSGVFANAADGFVYASEGLTRFDVTVDAANKRVRLSNASKNYWAAAAGADWTNGTSWALTQPNGSAYAAYFGTNLTASGQVTLNEARTVRSLFFNNALSSYTVAGSGSLTLQDDAFRTPAISVIAGSHTLSVPLALSSATTVTVENVAVPAGLYEGRLAGVFNTNSPNPQTSVQLSTRYANIYYVSSALSGGVWVDSSTYAYTGYIWNQTGTNTTWTFAKNFDDSVYLAIDGVAVINNTSYNTFVKANYTLTPGGHTFDLRLGQGVANVGASGGWGVQYDPLGRDSTSLADYRTITDSGNGSLLTTVANPTLIAGSLTLAGNVTGGQAVTKTGLGTLALSGNSTLGALTVSSGTVRQASGMTSAGPLAIASGARLDLATGSLTCDSLTLDGTFNFLRGGVGTLYIRKGAAGGSVDTIGEVTGAISGGLITLGGLAAAPSDFSVKEETINSVVYVKVAKSIKGTVLLAN